VNNDFILGVDLAQSSDFTAITILERIGHDTGKTETYGVPSPLNWIPDPPPMPTRAIPEKHYQAQYLERLPIGTPYPAQVARIKQLHDELRRTAQPPPLLVVDKTGVGAPVVDMLRAAGLSPAAVTITGGDAVTQDGSDYRVPKRDLVSVVQVLLQSERLKIARALPEAQTLTSELLAFKVSISLKGHDSYGNDAGMWRENPHDDLVLAVALAAWYGERHRSVVHHAPPSLSFRGSRYSGRR